MRRGTLEVARTVVHELAEKTTAEDFSVVQNEGGRVVRRTLKHYSLDAIIAVGYRLSSKRATQFRIWATKILKEYIRKGFVLDDERLKQGKQVFGQSIRAGCGQVCVGFDDVRKSALAGRHFWRPSR